MTDSTDIATRQPTEVGEARPMAATNPAELIQRAMDRDMSPEQLGQFLDIAERLMDRQAEQAFADAMSAFQQECPDIPKARTAEVRKGGALQYTYDYAGYEDVVRVVGPVLAKHGFSHTFDAEVDSAVTTICTLQHSMGAKRTARFTCPVDNSGGKNPIQGVGSSIKYGQRYALLLALGIATADDDGEGVNDRVTQPVETITDEQEANLVALTEEVGGTVEQLAAWARVPTLSQVPASRYGAMVAKLKERRGQ